MNQKLRSYKASQNILLTGAYHIDTIGFSGEYIIGYFLHKIIYAELDT
jgi:hypothetical protein